MYYPDEIIEEIRAANDIVDVISSYVKLTKKGSSYFGLCPFHSEKTGSFSVSRSKQMYYCFGCHAGGNVITFVMQYENYTFDEAIKMLADRVGIKLPEVKMSQQSRQDKDLKTKLLEIHKIAANYYYHELVSESGKTGLDYFHGRKLTDDTIRHFGLGYTGRGSDRLYKMLKEKGYDDEILKQSGLVVIEEKGTHDKFWNRVMFPLMDVNNKVIGFGGRVLGDGTPKYMNSPETKIFEKNKFLFGLNYARKTRKDYFFLCEGNIDVISMHQAGYTNAVASLGTSLTANQPALIKRYVNKCILTYDSDDAGVAAAQRAIPMLNDAGISVKILNLDPYKDPDEFLNNLGNEEFDKRVRDAENSFIWNLRVSRKKFDMQDPAQQTEFIHLCANELTKFSEAIERDNYIKAVSAAFMIDYKNLKSLVNSKGNKGYGASEYFQRREDFRLKKADEGIVKTQNFVLSVMFGNKKLSNQICKYLKADDFDGDIRKNLFSEIAKAYETSESAASVINEFNTDTDKMNQIADILNSDISRYDIADTDEDTETDEDTADRDEFLNTVAAAVLRVKQNALDNELKNAADINAMQEIIRNQSVWKNKNIVFR